MTVPEHAKLRGVKNAVKFGEFPTHARDATRVRRRRRTDLERSLVGVRHHVNAQFVRSTEHEAAALVIAAPFLIGFLLRRFRLRITQQPADDIDSEAYFRGRCAPPVLSCALPDLSSALPEL